MRFLPLEEPLGVARQFENLHVLIHVGLLDRLVLVAMAGVQCIAHPLQHLVVELQKSQKFGELLFQQVTSSLRFRVTEPIAMRTDMLMLDRRTLLRAGSAAVAVRAALAPIDHRRQRRQSMTSWPYLGEKPVA